MRKNQFNYIKLLIFVLAAIYGLGIYHSIKKHPNDKPSRRAGLLAFHRGIEFFFHTDVKEQAEKQQLQNSDQVNPLSFKSYECRRISRDEYQEGEKWIIDGVHSKDSIIVYGESSIRFMSPNDIKRDYKVVKNNGRLNGRPNWTEAISFICKNNFGKEVEIIFERNDIKKIITIIVFDTEYVYEYQVEPRDI